MTAQATTCYPYAPAWQNGNPSVSGLVATLADSNAIVAASNKALNPCLVGIWTFNYTGTDLTPVPTVSFGGVAASVQVSNVQQVNSSTGAAIANAYTCLVVAMLPYNAGTSFTGSSWSINFGSTTATALGSCCGQWNVYYNVDPVASAAFALGVSVYSATLQGNSYGYQQTTYGAISAQRGDYFFAAAACRTGGGFIVSTFISPQNNSVQYSESSGTAAIGIGTAFLEAPTTLTAEFSTQLASGVYGANAYLTFVLRPIANLQGVVVANSWTSAPIGNGGSGHAYTAAIANVNAAINSGFIDPVLVVVPAGWSNTTNLASATLPTMSLSYGSQNAPQGAVLAMSHAVAGGYYNNMVVGYIPLRGLTPLTGSNASLAVTDSGALFPGTPTTVPLQYLLAYNVDPASDRGFTATFNVPAAATGNLVSTQQYALPGSIVALIAMTSGGYGTPLVNSPNPDTNGVAGPSISSNSNATWLSYTASSALGPAGFTVATSAADPTVSTGLGIATFLLNPYPTVTYYEAPTGLAGTPSPTTVALTWTGSAVYPGSLGASIPTSLLHFDGANGGTLFPDSAIGTPPTWSPGGGVTTSTSQFKYGTASMLGGPLGTTVVSGGSLDFGQAQIGDFTAECWVYQTGSGGAYGIFELGAANGYGFRLYIPNASMQVQVFGSLETSGNLSAPTIALNGWHHVAVVKDNLMFRLFIDGVEDTSRRFFTSALGHVTGTAYVGGSYVNSSYDWPGYIDEWCFTPMAKYQGPFTPVGPFLATPVPPEYVVERNTSAVAYPAATAYTDTGLAPGTLYAYNIAAYSGSALLSPLSATLYVTTTYVPSNSYINSVFDDVVLQSTFQGQLQLAEFTYYPMRPAAEGETLPAAVNNMIINRYKQEPTDTRVRGVDFTLFCQAGEYITSVEAAVVTPTTTPPLVITNILIDPVTQQIISFTASGGVDGTEYTVQFTVNFNTANSLTEEVIFSINIYEESQFP